jgi:VanZ family protein
MRWLRQWGPAVVWAGVIFALSTQNFSSGSTAHYILPALRWLFPHAAMPTLEMMHLVIRKSAHFAEYFIFSLLVLHGVRGGRKGWELRWALSAVVVVACYAVLDEVHQAFVPNRWASPLDSLLDTTGATAAQIAWWLRARWHTHRIERAADHELPTGS